MSARVAAEGEKYFKNGIDLDAPRQMNYEFTCAGLFYLALFVQLIMAFVIFGSKNAEVGRLEQGRWVCPGDYQPALLCGNVDMGLGLCVNSDLCEEIKLCNSGLERRLGGTSGNMTKLPRTHREALRELAMEEGPAPARRLRQRALAGRMLNNNEHVPENVWEFLEEHAYQPIVLFLCAAILAAAWLFFLQKAALTAIWGTIAADIILLLVVFLWYKIDFDIWNWFCIVGVVLLGIGAVVLRPQISDTAIILTQAMNGLRANVQIFAVSAAVQLVWVLYFAQWIAAIIGMHFVLTPTPTTVDDTFYYSSAGDCDLSAGFLGSDWMALFFVICYYWATYFARNVILMLVTANITGWYFEQPDSANFWRKALVWSVGPQGGGNAMASAIMGASEYLLKSIENSWSSCFAVLNPWNWIIICIALALKTVLQTYTKFGLIAMTFSGRPFCESAGRGFALLSSKLGSAVLTDYLGSRLMSWASYVIALVVTLAAWAWADSVQGVSSAFAEMGLPLLIFTVVLVAYFLSYPFITLVLLVLVENLIAGWLDGDWQVRARFNSIMASLFMGSIAMFILAAISKLVINAMDVIFFCFAVEADNEVRQERFEALYLSIKCSIVEGGIQGENVAQGQAVGQAPQGQERASEPARVVVVVGNPVNNNAASPETA